MTGPRRTLERSPPPSPLWTGVPFTLEHELELTQERARRHEEMRGTGGGPETRSTVPRGGPASHPHLARPSPGLHINLPGETR